MYSLVSQPMHPNAFLPALVPAYDAPNYAHTYRFISWEPKRPGVCLWLSYVSLRKSLDLSILIYKIRLRKPTIYIPYTWTTMYGNILSTDIGM